MLDFTGTLGVRQDCALDGTPVHGGAQYTQIRSTWGAFLHNQSTYCPFFILEESHTKTLIMWNSTQTDLGVEPGTLDPAPQFHPIFYLITLNYLFQYDSKVLDAIQKFRSDILLFFSGLEMFYSQTL